MYNKMSGFHKSVMDAALGAADLRHGEGQALALRYRRRIRGMARDRPSPYGEGDCFFTVARGPVPRDLPTSAENARRLETPDVCCADRCMARDRPSPYDERGRFGYRSAGALGCHTRIRAGFPRDLST